MEKLHEPVLLDEALEALAPMPSDVVVDATLGGAGHFARLLGALEEGGVIVGIDADPEAVERAREVYAQDRRPERPVAHLVVDNFRNLARILERLNLPRADAILFDLGWSGYQLASSRGFSFAHPDQPLLMTYGSSPGETAADLVNSLSEEALADIIFSYGEERFARPIAASIVSARRKERILTVGGLVAAIEAGTPKWYHERRLSPATKTFQALRIAVNDELDVLSLGLAAALSLLAPGGRLAVITFHSAEDRIVKRALQAAELSGIGALSPKKHIVPTRAEVVRNRRARSAKLRVFVRTGATTPVSASTHTPFFSYA
ncbi:MAG: 16S rRNA (cytosine(1402)-N(4))-methyltransferase RsmH [bacterium]|nr:16S rRNA (cytosine(1402)-N(4))-methyltransferase RsmH [bacterium]